METFKVTVNQRLEGKGYPETIIAEFEDMEQAMIFGETVLRACKNTTIELAIVNDEVNADEKDN